MQIKLKSGEQILKIKKEEKDDLIFGFNNKIQTDNGRPITKNGKADIYLPLEFDLAQETPLFRISFDKSRKLFYFRVLDSDPLLIQVRVDSIKPWRINKNDKFLLGDMIFKFEPAENNQMINITRLLTKKYTEKISKTFLASSGVVTLGRYKNATFFIESSLLSRIHASLEYNKVEECWELRDGETGKASANGCFVFTSQPVEVSDKLEIKINEITVILYLN